jgi:hypothetical protein
MEDNATPHRRQSPPESISITIITTQHNNLIISTIIVTAAMVLVDIIIIIIITIITAIMFRIFSVRLPMPCSASCGEGERGLLMLLLFEVRSCGVGIWM